MQAPDTAESPSPSPSTTLRRRRPRAPRPSLVGLLVTLCVLAAATLLALLQAPHPDMHRPLARWDLTRLDWWAWPLERNAFRRSVVRGNLRDVFALPGEPQQLWVVGEGGLILHSSDGGLSWEQQRPRLPASPRAATARTFTLMASAHAAEPPPDPKLTAQREWEAQKAVQAPVQQMAPPVIGGFKLSTNGSGGTEQPPPTPTPLPEASAPAAPPPTADPGHALLHRVQFVDALRGWAVGESGTILASENGGRDWALQASGTRSALRGLHFLPGGLVGWAVGDEGIIRRTLDGGRSWGAQSSGTRAALHAVHFLADGQNGWIAGANGLLLFTRDGGTRWQAGLIASRAPTGDVHDIRALRDGRRVLAVGADGVQLASQDGGANWTRRVVAPALDAGADGSDSPARPAATLYRLALGADEQQVWVAASDGQVLVSADGGQQWQRHQTPERGADLQGVASDGADQAWVVGDGGSLLRGEAQGQRWIGLTAGVRASLLDASFIADGLRGWVVGPAGSILATRDGGDTWEVQASDSQGSLLGVHFLSGGLRGWAVGADGLILHTADGGDHWRAQQSDSRATLRSVYFLPNGRNGWITGDDGELLTSSDGGDTWRRSPPATTQAMQRILFAEDGQRGWMLGGSLFASLSLDTTAPHMLLTQDGGRVWRGVRVPVSGALQSIAVAADGRRAWAVGLPGILLASNDGGESWRSEKVDGKPWLFDVFASADGQRVWVAGSEGSLLATRNGGSSWTTQQTGTRNWLRHVSFNTDGERGRALGAYATVLTTDNGGNQWKVAAQYRRYLAPWYYLVLVGGLLVLLLQLRQAWQRASAPRESDLQAARAALAAEEGENATDLADHGVAVALASDQPVNALDKDRLGYAAAIEALRDFLRNEATEPRITMAISGPWGSGKSSMMRMLQSELERIGFRTAWFNAWHHQQEGRPLAALFNTIRRQAVPSFFRRPVAALRVRSRLIWGRGPFYKLVSVGIPLLVLLALGDMTHEPNVGDRLLQWAKHHLLQMDRTVLTDKSIQQLRPAVSACGKDKVNTAGAQSAPIAQIEAIRCEVFDYMERALVWESADKSTATRSHCADPRPVSEELRCVFNRPEQMLATIEKHAGVVKLWPSERRAILKAAEKLEPSPLFPGLEHFLLPLFGVLALLFTKGISVYGLQLLKPVQALLISTDKSDGSGKEPTGSIEHYRREFALLTDALDGRLVVFVDDLDRCDPATVNSLMEMTNYLVDVGRCFIVLGMAMDHVKACIQPRTAVASQDQYATEYLRKLVHIELPVPVAGTHATLSLLGDATQLAPSPPPGAQTWRQRLLGSLQAVGDCVLPQLKLPVWGALLVALVSGAIWLGVALNQFRQAPPLPIPAPASTPATAQSAALAPDTQPLAPPGTASRDSQTRPSGQADVGVSQPAPFRLTWPWFAITGLLLALLAMSPRILRERLTLALGGVLRTQDSDHFRAALHLWHEAVRLHDATPRGIKRFFNRARLFAMYEQQDMERLRATGVVAEDIDEAHVVALAAIHHVSPDLLLMLPECTPSETETDWARRAHARWMERTQEQGPSLLNPLFNAMQAHQARFGVPPRAAIERFIQRVERIQVR